VPSPQLRLLVEALKPSQPQEEVTVESLRQGYEAMAKMDPTPPDVNVQPVEADGVSAEWIAAPGASDQATVLWLHGGGYTIGSLTTHRTMISRISRASGARALAVDYRLGPEQPFPAALEDAMTAYRWLIAYGVDPKRLVVGGDSAGGGLAIAALVALRDAGDPLPAAAVCVSPWTDLELTGESIETNADAEYLVPPERLRLFCQSYLAGADARDPRASPYLADLSQLPPTLIQVGTAETLLDDSKRIAAKAKGDGVDVTLEVWDEMIHHWHIYAAMLPEGQQAIDRIGEFVREHAPVTATS